MRHFLKDSLAMQILQDKVKKMKIPIAFHLKESVVKKNPLRGIFYYIRKVFVLYLGCTNYREYIMVLIM